MMSFLQKLFAELSSMGVTFFLPADFPSPYFPYRQPPINALEKYHQRQTIKQNLCQTQRQAVFV
jgi:hypothetical protein